MGMSFIIKVAGGHMNLKGTMSYYKVDEKELARSLAHFDIFKLNKKIVVLLTEKMTKR